MEFYMYIAIVLPSFWISSIATGQAIETNSSSHGVEHGVQTAILRSLKDDVSTLKSQHALTLNHLSLTLSHVKELQKKLQVMRNDLRNEKKLRLSLEKDIILLNKSGCCENLQKNFWREMSKMKTDVNTKIGSTTTSISRMKTKISDRQRNIYFTAAIRRDINRNWASYETIKFTHVISNEGGGYDASTGIFTAPRNGVYVFMCYLGSYKDYGYIATMLVNGQPKVGIPAASNYKGESEQVNSHTHGAAGNSVVLQLKQGDRVWIAHVLGKVLWSHPYFPYSTFSGYLLS